MKNKSIPFSRKLIVVAGAAVLAWHLLALAGHVNAEDSLGRHSNPLEVNTSPAVGNIAGIKLSIPHNYLLSGVHYKGEEVWARSYAAPPPRSFDSEIEDFALLLRQSTLQPVRTKKDWSDYLEFGRTGDPPPGNRWLTMGFHPDTYVVNSGSVKGIVDRYMLDGARRGPFVLQGADVYELKHAVSTKQEKEKSFYLDTDEFFYDNTTWGTFITCSNYHRSTPPFDPLTSCNHLFVVPELKVVVELHGRKDDLPRWREIESAIKKIAHSFVVE